jgi:hypothetical protein
VFQFLQASWAIRINPFFDKFVPKYILQGKVWPKGTPSNALTKELVQMCGQSSHHIEIIINLIKVSDTLCLVSTKTIVLPVGVLLSYSVLLSKDAHAQCQTLHEQQKPVYM